MVRPEHPRASDLRRTGAFFVTLAATSAVIIGVVLWSIEALLIGLGLTSAGLTGGAVFVESMGLLPRGSSPRNTRRLMISLLSLAAALELVALVLKASHNADSPPAIAGLVCSVAAGGIAARLLTR